MRAWRWTRTHVPGLRRVLNATGIVVHTNLGRAPMAPEAAWAAAEAARGACDLELDLETGRRGPRAPGLEALLRQVTGAQAGLCVNNNAAALLLALTALAGGGEVIVSRGELVEIGGGFRIPDIIQQGGARLVEVGTTNRTRLADYEAAITPRTRMLLKVHQSNFGMVGFTEETRLQNSPAWRAREACCSWTIWAAARCSTCPAGLAVREPTVAESVAAGSRHRGVQRRQAAGRPASRAPGRAAPARSARLRRHPLVRALRPTRCAWPRSKRRCASTQAPMPWRACRCCACWRKRTLLEQRADRLCARWPACARRDAEAAVGHAGGGALPGLDMPSRAVALGAWPSAEALAPACAAAGRR